MLSGRRQSLVNYRNRLTGKELWKKVILLNGIIFVVSILSSNLDSTMTATTFDPRKNPGQCGVLIADDDPSSLETLQEALAPEPFETFLASCGREAVDIVRNAPVHMMILDLHMPDMTALDVLRFLLQSGSRLPSILISGDFTTADRSEAFSLEASAVLAKPVDLGRLRIMVHEILSRCYPGLF